MTVTINYSIAGGGGGSSGGGGTGTVKSVNGNSPDGAGNVALTALSLQALPQAGTNTWNASTNTPTLASSTIPGTGILAYTVSVAGTTTLDGISTWNVGDVVYQTGTVWGRISANPTTNNVIIGDGTGGLVAGSPGINYGAPITFQNYVEIIVPSSGSIANNGALTLTTALQNSLPDGCWMSFPVGAIAAGIPATTGVFYWVVMSSTTVGTIYNNTYTPGTNLPTVPASPTAFVTTGPGAYTQSTSAIPMYKFTIPGNSMGPNGSVYTELWLRSNSNANTKTLSCNFAGAGMGPFVAMTTAQEQAIIQKWGNKQSTQKQKSYSIGLSGSGNLGVATGTVNTTVNQTYQIACTLAVATDWMIIDHCCLIISGAP